MALRLDDVQPPNTAATQSLLISFCAFSANSVGSEAASSPISWICLPSTPPCAVICSTAKAMASRTVTSDSAIVHDSEFSDPTLIVGPEVSTHDCVFAASVLLALLPQPDNSKLVATTTLPAARAGLFNEERCGSRMNSLSSCQHHCLANTSAGVQKWEVVRRVSNRHVRARVFL